MIAAIVLAHNGQVTGDELALMIGAFAAPVVLLAIVLVVGKLRGRDDEDDDEDDDEA